MALFNKHALVPTRRWDSRLENTSREQPGPAQTQQSREQGLPKIPHPTFTAVLFTTSNRWDPPSAPPWTTGWLEGRGKGGTPGWSAVPPSEEGNPATGTTVSSETSVTKGQTLCDCTQGRAEPGPIHGHRELKGAARGRGARGSSCVLGTGPRFCETKRPRGRLCGHTNVLHLH